jgi:carotenoid cleavage dioxygenase-like enzyme
MSSSTEPFVRDCYFEPVPDEITARDLPVVGTLPTQLNGTYLRNGPNPRPGSPYPFFAGDGMVHGIRLEAGQARWYRNRYVKTRRDAGIRGGASSNTHVFAHAGHILSFVEVALPIELDRQLETVGPVDFGGIDTAFTAHRHAYTIEYSEIGPGNVPRSSLLRRYDVDKGRSVVKDFGVRYEPGEPVFVPKSADAAENDGWILALRYDREQDRSDLVVLDANEFSGDPVAVVQLPRRVPIGLHGSRVAD